MAAIVVECINDNINHMLLGRGSKAPCGRGGGQGCEPLGRGSKPSLRGKGEGAGAG